jgi:hypothetical protein
MGADYKTRLRGKNNPNYREEKDKICPACGKILHPNNNHTTYCSLECYTSSEQKRIDARAANDKTRKPPGNCKICGSEIYYARTFCQNCKPKPKEYGRCENCGEQVKSYYDVQYCKKCRKKGLHKKKIFSVCTECGKKIYEKYNRKYCDKCLKGKYRMPRNFPRKVDENQKELVDTFLQMGFSVIDTSSVGGGFPDLILGKDNKNYLVEIKNEKAGGRLNELQVKFFTEWKGQCCVIWNIEQAVDFYNSTI